MTLFQAFGQFAGQAAAAPIIEGPGMVLMEPTSVAGSGVTLSGGLVSFSSATSISVNGCFSADFDNYVVAWRGQCTVGGEGGLLRLRASGSDASGTDYTRQRLQADGASISPFRQTSQTSAFFGNVYDTQRDGWQIAIYGPYLAQPTAFRSYGVSGGASAFFDDAVATHSLSTSYDGLTFFPSAQAVTGAVAIYGVRS